MPFVQWIMHKLFYERGGELFIAVVSGFLAYMITVSLKNIFG